MRADRRRLGRLQAETLLLCLFQQNPSSGHSQSKRAWRRSIASELGGACLAREEALRRLERGGEALEAVWVELGSAAGLSKSSDSQQQEPASLQ
jgi:hypothetical protein